MLFKGCCMPFECALGLKVSLGFVFDSCCLALLHAFNNFDGSL